jgi:hypothetical protein
MTEGAITNHITELCIHTDERGGYSMAEIVPFPLARRKGFIARHARLIVSMRPEKGLQHLERQVQFQAEVLLRRNIDASLVEREAEYLRDALRDAVTCVSYGGSVA